MKGSEPYQKKLDKEFSNLNFPNKPDIVSIALKLTPNHLDSLFPGIGVALI